MTIGLITVRISIPDAQSLKDKRSVLKSMKDRLLNKMNVSVAEVGSQNEWEFAELAIVTVAGDSTIVQSRISKVSSCFRSDPRYVLVDLRTELM